MKTYTVSSWNSEDGEWRHIFDAATDEYIVSLPTSEWADSEYEKNSIALNTAANMQRDGQTFIGF